MRPERVVSNPQSVRCVASSPIRCSSYRPARTFCDSGSKGDRPAAIRSAFRNSRHFANSGRNSAANVVFPAPLGPARTYTVGGVLGCVFIRPSGDSLPPVVRPVSGCPTDSRKYTAWDRTRQFGGMADGASRNQSLTACLRGGLSGGRAALQPPSTFLCPFRAAIFSPDGVREGRCRWTSSKAIDIPPLDHVHHASHRPKTSGPGTSSPKGFERVAGGSAQRYPRKAIPNTARTPVGVPDGGDYDAWGGKRTHR